MKKYLTIMVLILTVIGFANGQSIRYVTPDGGAEPKDGTSWDNAYSGTDLQTAIDKPGVTQVWVAAGTYKPPIDPDPDVDPRSSSFHMKSGVAIYGGFAGTETDLSERDWTGYRTNLDGGIGTSEYGDNSYHVIYNTDLDNTAILDGFTIQGGYSSGNSEGNYGGGIYNSNSSPIFTNCTISSNYALDGGGGIYNNDHSSPTMDHCLIKSNSTSGDGGGMYNSISSSPTMTNCNIISNHAYAGGGMSNNGSSPIMNDCYIWGNTAQDGGGIHNVGASPVLTNCEISGNSAIGVLSKMTGDGGGVYNSSSSTLLTNCTITGNSATTYGGGIFNYSFSYPVLTNCLITQNSAWAGGGISNYSSSPVLINCTIAMNSAQDGGGIFLIVDSYPTIKNSIIWGNTATSRGNQIYIDYLCTLTLSYSCYANGTDNIYNLGTITPDVNCINTNPRFFNPNSDFRIAGDSPCADAGYNGDNGEATDIRGPGYGRKLSKVDASPGIIDMGAYEFNTILSDPTAPELIFFVNANVSGGTGDGTSWDDAYTSLQPAINAATQYYEIWVAAGTYKPAIVESGDPRTSSFKMKNDVSIYGGFYGTETSLNNRNIANNITILTGNIGNPGDNGDNSYHVVYNNNVGSTAVLDGFTIQDGLTTDNGGGIYNENSSPTFTNCKISGNSAANGGGIYNFYNSSPMLSNCTITSNTATTLGGGMYNTESSSLTLTNCVISGNHSASGGGVYNSNSNTILTNCTISGNSAQNGGGIYNYSYNSTTTKVYNSIIWGNTATTSGYQLYNNGGTTTLNYSCYASGTGDVSGGGPFSTDANCITTDPKFVFVSSKDYRIFGNSPCKDQGNNGSFSATNVDIRGQLRIQNTTIDMGAYEWTSGVDPNLAFIWTGTASNNWNATENWSSNSVPLATSVVSIPDVTTYDPIVNENPGTPAVCNDLMIETGAVLTIAAGKALTVYGTLTNGAGTDGLVIKSDATSTGSLITSSTPNAKVERYVNAWSDATHGWHLLSSPVSSQAIDPQFTSPSAGDYDFYSWWEPTNEWVNFKNTTVTPVWNTANVLGPTSGMGNFIPGKGYLAAYQASASRRFSGTLNSADITISGLTLTSGTYGGWHLLGNPFPSALNLNIGNWALTNITSSVKIWKESTAAYVDIPSTGGGIILEGNGFMVETSGTGSLIIPAAARVHNATSWYKSSEGLLKLVAHDPDNSTAQESIIKVSGAATEGFDPQYDSHFLAGYAPKFYSTAGNEQLSTNTLPGIGNSRIIPMEFVKNSGTNFSIELAENSINGISSVYLTDKKTGTVTELSKSPVYSFSASESDNANRFELSFISVLSVKNEISSSIEVYTFNKTLFIHQTDPQKGTTWVYDIAGKLVCSKSLESSTSQSVNLQGFAPGVYLVSIKTNKGLFNQKIVLK